MYTDAYADAIRPEQLEQAVATAVALKYNQPYGSLEDCVTSAVQQVFCPCVTRDLPGRATSIAPLRPGLVDTIMGHIRRSLCAAQEGGRAGEAISAAMSPADTAPPAAELPSVELPPAGLHQPEDEKSRRKRELDDALDDALAQTFPASDPIANLLGGN